MSKQASNKAPRWSPRVPALIVLCLLVGLSACGQKGPLYLPQPEPPAETEPAEEN